MEKMEQKVKMSLWLAMVLTIMPVVAPARSQGLAIVTLKVEGIYCISCADILEVALGRLAGVKRSEMNVEEGTITVEYEEGKVTVDEIVDEINKLSFLGFQARPPASRVKPSSPLDFSGCCYP